MLYIISLLPDTINEWSNFILKRRIFISKRYVFFIMATLLTSRRQLGSYHKSSHEPFVVAKLYGVLAGAHNLLLHKMCNY